MRCSKKLSYCTKKEPCKQRRNVCGTPWNSCLPARTLQRLQNLSNRIKQDLPMLTIFWPICTVSHSPRKLCRWSRFPCDLVLAGGQHDLCQNSSSGGVFAGEYDTCCKGMFGGSHRLTKRRGENESEYLSTSTNHFNQPCESTMPSSTNITLQTGKAPDPSG